jgi:hypothetical protein
LQLGIEGPSGLAVDNGDSLLFDELGRNRVCRINKAAGNIGRVAGDGRRVFGSDGEADLLVKNTDRHIPVLLVNGTSVSRYNPLVAGSDYTPIVTGNFNGDGKVDWPAAFCVLR